MRGWAVLYLIFASFFSFKAVQGVRRGKMMSRGGMVYRRGRANWPLEFWFWVGASAFVALLFIVVSVYLLIAPSSP